MLQKGPGIVKCPFFSIFGPNTTAIHEQEKTGYEEGGYYCQECSNCTAKGICDHAA